MNNAMLSVYEEVHRFGRDFNGEAPTEILLGVGHYWEILNSKADCHAIGFSDCGPVSICGIRLIVEPDRKGVFAR